MLKLPVCPYCGAEFLYSDVKRAMRGKSGACPHCGKRFRVVKKRVLLLLFTAVFLLFWCNIFLLRIQSMNLIFLTVFTAGGFSAAYFTIPFTVRYRPF